MFITVKTATMSEVSPVFADYATITLPLEHFPDALASLKPWLDGSLCVLDTKSTADLLRYRSPSGGLLTAKAKSYGVSVFTASGRFMGDLRSFGVQSSFLSEFASFPHNVSSADLTVDEYRDDVPSRLVEIYEMAANGQVSFTRKHIGRSAVRRLFRPALYNDCDETGSIYIGKRGSHEVHSKCYDKRNEMLDRGLPDPVRGTLRHEMTVSGKMGITLRDLDQPHDCFYHFYPSNLLAMPQKRHWEGWGEGFSVEKPVKRLPSQILADKVENSLEISSLLDLADQVGEKGFDYFISLLRNKHFQMGKGSIAA